MRISRLAAALASIALLGTLAAGCSGGDSASTSDGVVSSTTSEQNGLEVGVQAPDFRLKDQDQTTVVLSDYLGTSNVIVVFYPLAFTPV